MRVRDPVAELGCGGLAIMAVAVAALAAVLFLLGVRVTFPWDLK